MHSIGIIGDKDSVMGFKATGIDVFYADDKKRIETLIDQLADRYAVLFITEKAIEQVKEKVAEYDNHVIPAIIPIPGLSSNTGYGMRAMKRSLEKAVGADNLFADE